MGEAEGLCSFTETQEYDSTYSMKGINTRMKNAGKVQVITSIGRNSEKFFVTSRIDWKPKKVTDLYLRR